MKKDKIITKDQTIKFLENKVKEQYEQRNHWVGLYYKMKQKRDLHRMAFKGVVLVAVMSFFIFFSLVEAIKGRIHTAITLWLAGMGFEVWSAILLVKLFEEKFK